MHSKGTFARSIQFSLIGALALIAIAVGQADANSTGGMTIALTKAEKAATKAQKGTDSSRPADKGACPPGKSLAPMRGGREQKAGCI